MGVVEMCGKGPWAAYPEPPKKETREEVFEISNLASMQEMPTSVGVSLVGRLDLGDLVLV